MLRSPRPPRKEHNMAVSQEDYDKLYTEYHQTFEENRALRSQVKEPPKKKRTPLGCLTDIIVGVFLLTVAGGFAIMGAMQLGWVPPLLLGPGINSTSTEATPTPLGKLPPTTPYSGGGGGGAPQLPPCSTISDTTTPCTGAPGTLPQGVQAEPTPTMALAPAAIECWQGSFYTCEELAEMGEEKAIEAVQQTDAFVDTSTLPTPEPAFVQYATDACAAAATKSILCP